MAAFTKLSEYLYSGVASDTKPDAATTTKGARAINTDTGDEFINNGTAWVEVTPGVRP